MLESSSGQLMGKLTPDLRRSARRDWWGWAVRLFLGVPCPSDEKPIFGRTRDLSGTGLGAVIPANLEPGDVVTLEFALQPNGPVLKVSAVVRHRRCYHYGFEFVALNPAASEAIQAACINATQVASVAVHATDWAETAQ